MRNKFHSVTLFAVSASIAIASTLSPATAQSSVVQKHLAHVDKMAAVPAPLKIIDYKSLSEKFDATIFDFSATGKYWPMIWVDNNHDNFNTPTYGIYTTVGDSRQGPSLVNGTVHEALTSMGAVLGASLVGIDKSVQAIDFVGELRNYFNQTTGWNIMQNNTNPDAGAAGGGYGRDWWYDVFPNVLFYAIYDKYPNEPGFKNMARSIADQFYQADLTLHGNYNVSYFDYGKMLPMTNTICPEADVAAGHAWVMYNAYQSFGDEKYLTGAKSALTALESNTTNPSYEVLMPFGAYLAARMNAEQNTSYDVSKLMHWSMDGTAVCRKGWGTLAASWNGYDVSGLVGSTVDHGGYGFLMNTYDMAWPLVPLVRYDQSWANVIGKWMLNAANAARFFYPSELPADHQTLAPLASLTQGVIAYEAVGQYTTSTRTARGTRMAAPIAQGDGPKWVSTQGQQTQFSVYGSAHVGIFGSLIKTTEVPGILRLDLLATDFFHDKAYPTQLIYNPYPTAQTVTLPVGESAAQVYDTVSGQFLSRDVRDGGVRITVPPQTSIVAVIAPASAPVTYSNHQMLIDGIVVDYHSR